MQELRVIGIVLVRNEDVFVERALGNVLPFCDKLHVLDNGSNDGTWEILERLACEEPKIELKRIENSQESHLVLEPYAGTNCWVFAVDGDEIYDPAGLERLKKELQGGRFERFFKVTGHTLHVVEGGMNEDKVCGYVTPAARTVTKLYNFSAIESWTDCPHERLHGGTVVFRDGFDNDTRKHLAHEESWEDCSLRCLHMCFQRRSSEDSSEGRQNISDLAARKAWYVLFWKYVTFALSLRLYRRSKKSGWKLEQYRRGEIVTKPSGVFFGG